MPTKRTLRVREAVTDIDPGIVYYLETGDHSGALERADDPFSLYAPGRPFDEIALELGIENDHVLQLRRDRLARIAAIEKTR